MNLKELIEIEGLESISEKTNISIFNLNSLANEDFRELNRVKALGFAQIIRREYQTDMEGLESAIKSYFEENAPKSDDNEPILVKPDKLKPKKGYFKWVILLALLALVGYLYSSGKLNEILNTHSDDAENILNDNEALKSDEISESDVKKNIVIKEDANGTKVEINTTQSIASLDTKSKDKNSSIKILADAQKKNMEEANQTNAKGADVEQPTVNTPEPNDKTTEIKIITINPTRGMLWYGFVNVDTRKKKEYMKKISTPFDLKGGRWLLTTGHGYLDIVSDIKTIKLADKDRHYFYIDSKDIREISKREFRRLNHGRTW